MKMSVQHTTCTHVYMMHNGTSQIFLRFSSSHRTGYVKHGVSKNIRIEKPCAAIDAPFVPINAPRLDYGAFLDLSEAFHLAKNKVIHDRHCQYIRHRMVDSNRYVGNKFVSRLAPCQTCMGFRTDARSRFFGGNEYYPEWGEIHVER